jgi:hypothetical protein
VNTADLILGRYFARIVVLAAIVALALGLGISYRANADTPVSRPALAASETETPEPRRATVNGAVPDDYDPDTNGDGAYQIDPADITSDDDIQTLALISSWESMSAGQRGDVCLAFDLDPDWAYSKFEEGAGPDSGFTKPVVTNFFDGFCS